MILPKLLAGAIHRLGTYFHHLSGKIYRSPQQRMVDQWSEDRGDETLRLNYDLDENSIVFDLGGYEGQWASDIFSRYCSTIHIFEPVADFAKRTERRFRGNKKIFVHDFGLAEAPVEDIRGGGPEGNAELSEKILKGEVSGACHDITVFNAGATIYASGLATSFEDGVKKAQESIASGKAYQVLEKQGIPASMFECHVG